MKESVLIAVFAVLLSESLLAEKPLENSNPQPTAASHDQASLLVLSPQHIGQPQPFATATSIASVSSLGGQYQISSNLNRNLSLRIGLSALYWKQWTNYGGFSAPLSFNLISESNILDFYPSPKHGFHLSSGFILHNPVVGSSSIQIGNRGSGTFYLNDHKYYSTYTPTANPNPFTPAPGPEPPAVIEQFHLPKMGYSLTAGWASIGRHRAEASWTFPFETGVAFLGSPIVKTAWIQGQICDERFQNCRDAAADAQFNDDVRAHFAPYRNRLGLFDTYPLLSIGVAHRFGLRGTKF